MQRRAHFVGELPGGYIGTDGRCHREVRLSALNGRDEMTLSDLPADAPMSRAITAAITLAVKRVGRYSMTAEIARALMPADRDYLLRKLWEVTFSNRVWSVVTCLTCATKMDTEFDLGAVEIEGAPQQSSYTARIDGRDIAFRLPRASDVEAVESQGHERRDPAVAVLARCILSVDDRTGLDEDDIATLPVASRLAIEAAIERECPDSELQLEATCPGCGQRVAVVWDVATQFFAALNTARGDLLRHVHLLSLYYHWPLTEILGLTTAARRQYVSLLLSNLNSQSGVEAVHG
jgi:hypothetical protein